MNHVYFGVDPNVVWRIATENVPQTLEQLLGVALAEGVVVPPVEPNEQ